MLRKESIILPKKASPGRPYANTQLVRFLERRALELRPVKTQAAIAHEAGFTATNMLAMIKSGSTRLPLDRVPALARALDADPAYLFRLALAQQSEALVGIVDEIFGPALTQNEKAWIAGIRRASANSDPTFTSKAERALNGVFAR
jgi:transcriptional regulator with XRE-family HTH domain